MTKHHRLLAGSALATLLAMFAVLPALASGSWDPQRSNIDGALKGVWFVDSTHGVAVGEAGANGADNQVLRTTDGGATWNPPTTLPSSDTLNRVFFSDKTHGLAVGEGVVLRTTDGGDHWTVASSGVPTANNQDLEAVFMLPDNQTAYASGGSGGSGGSKVLIKSTNGGQDWTDASAGLPDINETGGGPTPYSLDAMWWVSASEGWLAGDRVNPTDPGLILHTTTGGTSWSVVNSNTDVSGYESMMFTDPSHGWAVGNCFVQSQVQKTSTQPHQVSNCQDQISRWNGSQWENVSPADVVGFAMQGVWFIDAKHGWAVGEDAPNGNPADTRIILFSSDGGTTWSRQSDNATGAANAGLNFVHAVDICHAWATGGDSLILAFTDTCPSQAALPALPKAGQPPRGPLAAWVAVAAIGASLVAAWATRLRLRT